MSAGVSWASGAYTRLASGVIFPLHETLKRHSTVQRRRGLERSQWASRQEVQQIQLANLRRFLRDVGERVPYYRGLFASLGFNPSDVNGVADLAALPLLTKADIRSNSQRMVAEGHGPISRYNTGGSSGEPLVFFIGKDRKSHDVAAKWRATRWWGVDIGDPEAVIWGSPIEHGAQDRIRLLRDRLLRSTLLPAFEMSESRLDGFIQDLRSQRPRMLFGYPSALALIARHAAARGVRLNDLGVRVAFVTSERLYDEQRAAIETAFACPVANGYGGRDAGFIAHQCPAGGMHLSAEDIVVETVDAQGRSCPPGVAGEIVVTHTATWEFPFIRYRTGDVGTLSEAICTCGRGLPLLADLQGRTTDFVLAQDGTVMHGLALIYVLRDLPGIASFKVTQLSRQATQVQIVREQGFEESRVPEIIEAFRKRLGASVEVRVDFVDAIAPEKSGKYRYIVSHALP